MFANFTKVTIAFLTLLFAQFLQAQNSDELFTLGMRAYQAKDYQKAALNFEKSALESTNANAYLNAANAYLKMGLVGEAMVNYERARYINPRNPETNANIAALISQIGGYSRQRTIVDSVLGELSNAEWIVAASTAFWISSICFAIVPLFIRGKNRFKMLGYVCVLVFVLSCAGTIYWSEMRNTVISISQDATLKLSPASNAPSLAVFPEGRRAIIRKRHQDYLMLQTPDTKWGWIKKDKVKSLWDN